MTLSTINVIEIADTNNMSVNQLVAFPDSPEGNTAAEALFVKLVRENEDDEKMNDEEIGNLLDDGYYRNDTYYVAIVHSEK